VPQEQDLGACAAQCQGRRLLAVGQATLRGHCTCCQRPFCRRVAAVRCVAAAASSGVAGRRWPPGRHLRHNLGRRVARDARLRPGGGGADGGRWHRQPGGAPAALWGAGRRRGRPACMPAPAEQVRAGCIRGPSGRPAPLTRVYPRAEWAPCTAHKDLSAGRVGALHRSQGLSAGRTGALHRSQGAQRRKQPGGQPLRVWTRRGWGLMSGSANVLRTKFRDGRQHGHAIGALS
jgi:hypothetical protein